MDPLLVSTTTQSPVPDHFPAWAKKICRFTAPLPEVAQRVIEVQSHLKNTHLTRQDPENKSAISLPLSLANTIAYTMSPQMLSHHIETRGPIPARPANDEEAQQQQAAFNLDQQMPFLSVPNLEHHGFNRAFLKSDDERPYTASGSPLKVTALLKEQRRDIHLLDKHSLNRISTATWNVIKSAFDVSSIDEDDLSPHVVGPHAFQLIIVTLSNRTLHAKNEIADRILALSSRTTPTVESLLELFRDTKALTLLHRVIQHDDLFFVKSASLLPKVLDYLQSSDNIGTLSPSVQGEFLKAIRFFLQLAQQNESILSTAVLTRLTPILLKSCSHQDSAHSAMLTRVRSQDAGLPSPRMDVETSFAAYHEHERRPRPLPSSERKVFVSNTDNHNSARRESGPVLPERTTQNSRQKPPAPSAYGNSRAASRAGSPPPDLWTELQTTISTFQSKVDQAKRQARTGLPPPPPAVRTSDAPRPRHKAYKALPEEYDTGPAWEQAMTATVPRRAPDARSTRDDTDQRSQHSFASSDDW